MSNPRVRVVAWRVQPVVMADDGENLPPVNVQPVEIPAREWQAFKDGGIECHMPAVADNGGIGDHSFNPQLSACQKSGCHAGQIGDKNPRNPSDARTHDSGATRGRASSRDLNLF